MATNTREMPVNVTLLLIQRTSDMVDLFFAGVLRSERFEVKPDKM